MSSVVGGPTSDARGARSRLSLIRAGSGPWTTSWRAELVGTAFLTLCIIGSGIAATRLSPGDHGFQLLLNARATGLGLVAIILAIGSVSGGQLNPAITLVAWMSGGLASRAALTYVGAQLVGASVGAVLANVIFGLPAVELAHQVRATSGLWASEVIATLGLVLVVFGLVRSQRSVAVPYAVGAYIGAAILFTSSTSFANPAATIARSLSNTFAGIAPASVPMFVLEEIAGGLLGFDGGSRTLSTGAIGFDLTAELERENAELGT